MSSNIKQKTTPPGSWPCPKGSGGGETREAEQHKAATPRSPPAAPEGLSFFERDGTGGSSVDYSQSGGEYTHRNPEAKGEGRKEEKEEGEKKEGPIEMKDESGGKEEEGEWKEAEPKPVEEEKVGKEEEGKEKGEEKETETVKASDDVEAAAGETGEGGQSLTDDAKREFDQAPENQRTDEARDEFIKTAKGNLASSQEEAGKEDVQELEVEEPEKSEAALQEKLAEEEENKPVEGKTTPEDQKATTETQEQPSEEQPSTNEAEKPTDTEEPAPEQEEEDQKVDFSILKNGTVNKGGYVINPDKKLVGRVIQGPLQHLVGKKVDENGTIWDNTGKEAGKAEPIPENERDELLKEPAPFESFPDAVVSGDGFVTNGPNGEKVGKVVEGNLKELRNKSVDADGDILDRGGNVIGKAERWEPEPEKEPEPEPEVDKSILAGKRVNKAGNVVDSHGTIYGRVVEGDVKKMVGRMCNKKGEVLSESGDKLGLAELVPEGERESPKEGPFADLEGCTVAKDGTVVLPSGTIVGRLLSGDPKVLFNRPVDEDGDILDKAGNAVGKAERWEPEPEPEKKKNPMSGRKVSKEGDVRDEDGNVIGKLTSGDVQVAAGKEVDDDGDVVNYKGNVVGHCSLLEDIPEEKPEETPEEREKREQAEKDKKLAQQMAACIEQCLDSIRPICKMITEKIDRAEATPEDERDEEQLVNEVKPLIEEGSRILNEAKGIIKGLDPDGKISANAKYRTASREATPEEYHLADVLKDLTGDVTQCIDHAKKKLEGMPHAKNELNPLWGLLNEPLFQILAAVGLLLAGVLNLVGRLLSGLGLGGLVDGLLGTLGLNRVLESLGLGSFSKSLKSGKKGGLLSGVLGG